MEVAVYAVKVWDDALRSKHVQVTKNAEFDYTMQDVHMFLWYKNS